MEPKEISTAIRTWTNSRSNSDAILQFLNQGYCFEITRIEYEKWKTLQPESIHAYPAVFSDVTKFVVIDNITDKQTTINYSNVFVKDYTYGSNEENGIDFGNDASNITILDALERIFRWSMNHSVWVRNQVSTEAGVFQAFHIPFSDLKLLFSTTTSTRIYALIGLMLDESTGMKIPELILWNETMNFGDPSMVADVALPVPPFGLINPVTNYQLLVQS